VKTKLVPQYIECLPEGSHSAVDVVKTPGHVLIRTASGEIFTTFRRISLLRPHGANQSTRRAYAKLAGIKVADIKRAMREQAANDKREAASADADRMRRLASRLGYKVTKAKP